MCNLPQGNEPSRPVTTHHNHVPSVGVVPIPPHDTDGTGADFTSAEYDPAVKAVQS